MARYRKRMSRRASKRNFKRGNRVKRKNYYAGPMRGGIRL